MENKDIQDLKDKNPILSVMDELGGFRFAKSESGDALVCLNDHRITVDPKLNKFFIIANDGYKSSGDVITWLRFELKWTFQQCLQYLKVRSKKTENERTRWAGIQEVEAPEFKPEKRENKSDFVIMNDDEVRAKIRYERLIARPRVQEANRLLFDWPLDGGFDALLRMDWFSLLKKSAYIPDFLMRVEGAGLYSYSCCLCWEDFDKGWPEGYIEINIDEDQKVGDSDTRRIFCVDCHNKFKRWYEGLDILFEEIMDDDYRETQR